MRTEPSGFREFVVARSPALLRTAWMLTGDQAAAEDLLQTALARTWPHWARIADGQPDAYVRKVMVRVNASWRARRWNQETPTLDADLHRQRHHDSDENDPASLDDRLSLLRALTTLPTRQRQVVVLRFFDDLLRGRRRRRHGLLDGNGQEPERQGSRQTASGTRSHRTRPNEYTMNTDELSDLLRTLPPPMDDPPDRFDIVQRRARRRAETRSTRGSPVVWPPQRLP